MIALNPRFPCLFVSPWARPSVVFTLLGLGLLCIGALPCFGRSPPSREHECASNLKSLYTGLRTTRPDAHQKEGFQPSITAFGFSPYRGNRYAYFLGPGPMEDRSGVDVVQVPGQMGIGVDTFKFHGHRALTLSDLPPDIAWQVGLQVTATRYEFIAACAGDSDDNVNDTPDIWSIADRERVIDGRSVEAGEPYQHVSDVGTN